MTDRQKHLYESHLRHVELVHDDLEAAGFEAVRLAEWSGGQPTTEYRRGGDYFLIFGYARIELYLRGVKADGARIHPSARHTFERLLAKAA